MSVRIMAEGTRERNGRFLKGVHAWRAPKDHWQKDWLEHQYLALGKSMAQIAAECHCTENNIQFWLKKHGIAARSMSEVRAKKYWGALGAANPMYGRRGAGCPTYVDGSAPERQRLYARSEGKDFLREVYRRDGYRCRRCSAPKTGPKSIHAHHIRPWAGNPGLRFDIDNAVTLCARCHRWVHSQHNVGREYLG